MIKQTISELEERIASATPLKPENRTELLQLLGTLKSEIAELSETQPEHAQSIAGFTTVSTHEATRESRNPELVRLSVSGLASSVDGFEKSHPRLVEIVNRICVTLSNLGI